LRAELRSLTVRNLTLHRLIAAAYGTPFPIPLPDERIVGGPEWLTTARFAVEARSAAPPDAKTAGAPHRLHVAHLAGRALGCASGWSHGRSASTRWCASAAPQSPE
jgi:hypothetical protein